MLRGASGLERQMGFSAEIDPVAFLTSWRKLDFQDI